LLYSNNNDNLQLECSETSMEWLFILHCIAWSSRCQSPIVCFFSATGLSVSLRKYANNVLRLIVQILVLKICNDQPINSQIFAALLYWHEWHWPFDEVYLASAHCRCCCRRSWIEHLHTQRNRHNLSTHGRRKRWPMLSTGPSNQMMSRNKVIPSFQFSSFQLLANFCWRAVTDEWVRLHNVYCMSCTYNLNSFNSESRNRNCAWALTKDSNSSLMPTEVTIDLNALVPLKFRIH